MSPEPLTYTVEEAAAALGCGRDSMHRLVRQGDIPHVRFGRVIRIPRDALTAWLLAEAERTAEQRRAV